MAENLRATKYANGSDITLFTTADGTDAWTNNTTGAYHIYGDNSEVLELFGALYSGYAVINEAGLAPRGWEVPTKEQWTALRKAGGPAATNFKLDDEIIWNENQGTNITGFDAYPAGYYSTATSDTADTTDTYWWTSTTFYDFLTRSNGLETVRINDKATNMVVSDSAGHDYLFGHSVRCIRK
jgi:uncharacterized protein (TIGR02145 family)